MRSTFGNAKTERRQSDAFAELEGEECPRTREASGSRRQRVWLLETGSFWNARKRARAQCMLHDPIPVLIFFPHALDPPPSSLPNCNFVLRATRLQQKGNWYSAWRTLRTPLLTATDEKRKKSRNPKSYPRREDESERRGRRLHE
jgi:hypothetical protein